MLPYCTYVTYHPIGKFYVGKGVTADVISGKYRGSGTILVDYFKKYPKDGWSTDITSLHEDEDAAYAQEAMWVDEALIDDPDCLNINLGGKGGCRRKQSAEEIAKRAAAIRASLADPEHRAMMSRVSKEASLRPEVQAKFSASSKKMWSDPTMKDLINSARTAKCDDAWRQKIRAKRLEYCYNAKRVEVLGVLYPTMSEASKATGMHNRKLRKHPTFKVIT